MVKEDLSYTVAVSEHKGNAEQTNMVVRSHWILGKGYLTIRGEDYFDLGNGVLATIIGLAPLVIRSLVPPERNDTRVMPHAAYCK